MSDSTQQSDREATSDPQSSALSQPPRSRWWLKVLKWLGISVATVVGILVLGTALLYLPPIQNWLLGMVKQELAERAGVELEWQHVGVAFPLRLRLEEVKAGEIGEIGLLTADVSLLPLLRGGHLPISGVVLERARANFSLSNDSIQIRGAIGRLALDRLEMDLEKEILDAGQLELYDSDIYLTIYTDTLPKPESEPSKLLVKLSKGKIQNVAAYITLPAASSDTLPPLKVNSYISRGEVSGVEVNLAKGVYEVEEVDLAAGVTQLGDSSSPEGGGLASLLPFPWYAEAKGKKVRYGGADDLSAELERVHYTVGDEPDSVVLESGRLSVKKDAERLEVGEIELNVGKTHLKGRASPFCWMASR